MKMAGGFACAFVTLLLVSPASAAAPTWIEVATSAVSKPSPRAYHAVAFDEARGVLVLFGGAEGSAVRGDTWEWDGTAWAERATGLVPKPSPRFFHAMAYDSARHVTVLFGGVTQPDTSLSDETWEWDGVSWTKREPVNRPSPRNEHAMVYDRGRARVVLFGGCSPADCSVQHDDTWEWDGNDWTQALTNSPGSRRTHGMAYDSARAITVLFGGCLAASCPGQLSDDTWEWDGSLWTNPAPATNPGVLGQHMMAFDAARARVVLFGGCRVADCSQMSDDTWEWDGLAWVQQAPGARPSARNSGAMAYDSLRHVTTLFGGQLADSSMTQQTWNYRVESADVTPPVVICSATPSVLWPPNGQLVPITVNVTVTDEGSGPHGFTLVSVTNSEADTGRGDIQGFAPPGTAGFLRATRQGNGPGRVYTLSYMGFDLAGNSALCTTTVTVPHGQGQ